MNGVTARKISLLASAWLVVVMTAVGCAEESPKHSKAGSVSAQPQPQPSALLSADPAISQAAVTDYKAQDLLGHRTPYVGNNSEVVALIDLLPLPSGLSREAVELQTAEEPYGVTIDYKLDMDTGITLDVENGDPFTLEQWLYRHAAILLSLIGNADYIEFKVDNARTISGGLDRYEYRLDRNDIEAVYGDVRSIAEDEKLFLDYVEKVKRIGAIDMSPPKVLQPASEGKYLLSHNEVRLSNGDVLYVDLEMTDGKHYTEEEAGGPGGGIYADNYRGAYRLRVLDSRGETVSTYSDLGGELNFSGKFDLAMADYNNDGRPDFTIGQFANSNGAVYEIYSLNERGEIQKLKSDRELYVADHSPSILLNQIDAASFSIRFYTPESGYGHRAFRWDGSIFAETKPEASQ